MKANMKTIFFATIFIFHWPNAGLCALLSTIVKPDNPTAKTAASTMTMEVKDYKSFLKYAAESERLAILAGKPALLKSGEIVKLEKYGIEIPEKRSVALTRDFKKVAYLATNKSTVILDIATFAISVVDFEGRVIREGKLPDLHAGGLAFSDTRLFDVHGLAGGPGGVCVYNYDGTLIKELNPGWDADGYVVSNSQKYFAAVLRHFGPSDFFVLYDMDGNEIWKQDIPSHTNHHKIIFSYDDKFAAIKLPGYWDKEDRSKNYKPIRKENKVYIIDVEKHKILSEEEYVGN